MTNQSPRKTVDVFYWSQRLETARAFLRSAQQDVVLAEPGQNMSPAVSQIVLSAIAFGDSLTAKRANVVNQQDHSAAPKLLREKLGNALPQAQERRYRRLLSHKDAVQYGAKPVTLSDAKMLLAELDEFSNWVDSVI